MLAPSAEPVSERLNEWLMEKTNASVSFSTDHLAWLHFIRDHIATRLSIEPDACDYAPFSQKTVSARHTGFSESDQATSSKNSTNNSLPETWRERA